MHKLSSQIFFYGQTCAYLQNQWKILIFVNKSWGEVKTSVFILNNIKWKLNLLFLGKTTYCHLVTVRNITPGEFPQHRPLSLPNYKETFIIRALFELPSHIKLLHQNFQNYGKCAYSLVRKAKAAAIIVNYECS